MQLWSSTSDVEFARKLAAKYEPYDPFAVKDYRSQLVQSFAGRERVQGDPVYYSKEEQLEL